ncbi:Nucleoside-triphosphate phosphatase [Chlorociboria aeruginascens]|nr:Nucleoside-triphosphate phosphatase [Chlorociboria aeruginascens]
MSLSNPVTPLNTNTPITPIYSTSTAPAPNSPLRILCFGDSLTEGYSRYGTLMTPYSRTLFQHLTACFPDRKITVYTDGLSGDLVVPPGRFLRRMEKRFSQADPDEPYTHVLFLGGTNDLDWGKTTANIIAALHTLLDIPLAHGCKVLLFTIPECRAKAAQGKVAQVNVARDEINSHIKLELGRREQVEVFDLRNVMPYHTMSARDVSEFWDDGVHFTVAGYRKVGEEAARRFVEVWGEELGAVA